MPEQAVVTGLGVEAAGLEGAIHLLAALEDGFEPRPFDPRRRLGERGWRYHDAATLMALCAATEALAGLPRSGDGWEAGEIGVVVSSNLGNLDTVCRVVETLRAGSSEVLSPMDLPKASSNIVASTLAIHFDCRGLNLTVCNGASSGLDALYLAAIAVRAGRARRLLVVGVEAAHPQARRLLEAAGPSATANRRFAGGAASVLVEAACSALARGAPIYAEIGGYAHCHGVEPVARSIAGALKGARAHEPRLWLIPETNGSPAEVEGLGPELDGRFPARLLDLSARLGFLYGALGVFQCVAASLRFQSEDSSPGAMAVLTSGGAPEGASSLVMRPWTDARSGA